MPSEPTLRGIQHRFYQLVTAPEGVAKGLEAYGLSAAELAQMVRGDDRLSAVDRLSVYANMYFFRIRDVLRDDYPKTVAVVGDDEFHNLVTDYLLALPPTDFTIRNAGERLPGFLAQHRLSDSFPWLADLAGLERHRTDVFDAPDARALGIEQLRSLAPEAFENLSLRLIPAHRMQDTRFAVHDLWRDLNEGRAPGELAPEPHTLLIWRREPLIFQRPLTPIELEVRSLLEEGTTLGAIGEQLAAQRPIGAVPPIAYDLLSRLVQEGLIAA